MQPPRIAMLDLARQHAPLGAELQAAAARVLAHGRFILGPEVQQLETAIAKYVGTPCAVGLSSGTDALLVALDALGIGPGDEVVTSGYSFFATVGAILRRGARPVLVDIEERGFNIDPRAVAAHIGPRTRAVVGVHLFGACCAVERIAELCPGVPIIEDAAQALGAERGGARAGGLGRVGCFSFFPSKNLGGCGDGGMLTTADPELDARARMLRGQGQPPGARHLHEAIGGNFRLDTLQAALLLVKLPHLEAWTAARRRNVQRYRRLFAEVDAPVQLPPEDPPGARHAYNQFVIRVDRRDALRRHLAEHGIASEVYYPRTLAEQPCLRELRLAAGELPNADAAAREALAIPVHPELTPQEIDEVAGRICGFLATRR